MTEGGSASAGPESQRSSTRNWRGLTVTNYRIVELLGRGGMAEVLLAEDLRLNRKVAIKVLRAEYTKDPERLRRFSQEARAASALNHPHIVALYDIGEADIGKYIVMEYVQGRTLKEACEPGLTLDRAIEWSAQIARALAAAHSAGIVHSDIKPENVMIRDDGYVKVLDFGLARHNLIDSPLGSNDATVEALIGAGQLLGTIRYMAPEQALGKGVTPATDIFSLGILIYEMVTRTHPFAAQAQVSVLHSIIWHEPIAPSRLVPEIYRWLDNLIVRMLAKDPAARPTASEVALELETAVHSNPETKAPSHSVHPFVGRENERAALRNVLKATDREGGKLICLVGEAGIGKTTLVEEFLFELELSGRRWLIGRGRCSERLAGSEAYLPFLEALGSLLRHDGDGLAIRALKLLAPTWHEHVASQAGIVSDERAFSQERMKREMGAFLEELTKQQPLVFFFDDLHWVDDSTVDMLAYIAGQLQSMRLVIVATYRPTEMLLARNPFLSLKLDLVGRSMCREVEIEYLTTADIDRYLGLVFRGHEFPEEFPRLIHARTEGNALFMTDLIEYLKDRGIIQQKEGGWIITEGLADIERNMPESVRSIVQRKIDQLQDNERRLLVAASIQGFDFDSASVARVLNLDPAEVEEQLDGLERIHTFVRFVEEKELPNRTVTLRYRFVHVLYQNALYASLRPTRRAQWSLAMAETLLDSYGERSSEIASNLAFLFETARDFARAADYSILAARNALQVFANKEAAALSRHALELLELLPPSTARTKNEIASQMTLGVALSTLKGGYSAPEVEAAYGRAFELCEGLGEDASVFPALYGLWSVHTMRANYSRALELGERMLPIARGAQDPMLLTMAHNALGFLKPFMGDYAGAESNLEEALRWHNREIQETSFARFGVEPRTGSLAAEAWVCWALGFPDKSRQRLREAYEMTEQVKHSISVAAVMSWAASLALDMEDFGLAKQRAEASMAYAADHGVLQGLGHSQYSRGSALACLGEIGRGIEEIRNAMRLLDAIGCDLGRTIMLLRIAELSGLTGDFTQASEALAEARAFATRTGEFYRASEFDRVEGNLLLLSIKRKEMMGTSPDQDEVIETAAQCFLSSMEIARSRQARSFELKTAIDLALLRQSQGKIDESRATLEPLLNWFTEGFDTPLLMRAQSVFAQRS